MGYLMDFWGEKREKSLETLSVSKDLIDIDFS